MIEQLKKKKFNIYETYDVECVTILDILEKNKLTNIDYLLSNCEGGELGFLTYIINNPSISKKIQQMCVALHLRIYGQKKCDYLLENLKKYYNIKCNDSGKSLANEYYLFTLK